MFRRKEFGQAALVMSALGIPILFAHSASAATTINVPGDQPTIQAGINAASDGDTVLVAPGTYTGNGNRDIYFNRKAITVMGSGADVTILDLQGSPQAPHHGFLFASAEGPNSVLQGFTISNGYQYDGGAIFVGTDPGAAGGSILTGPTITQCVFSNNQAGDLGGAIFMVNSNATVSQCVFKNNSAVSPDGIEGSQYGGAIEILSLPFPPAEGQPAAFSPAAKPALGFKPAAIDPSAVKLVNNVFLGNEAGFDGAALDITGVDGFDYTPVNNSPVVYIDNCSFNGNFDDYDGGGDGATGTISYYGGNFTISNSILYGDLTASELTHLTNPDNSTALIQNSDIQGGIGALSGTGNVDVDPQFVDAAGGDLRLAGNSPVINAGGTFETTPSTDFAGATRDANPDMGAYEYILDVSPTDQGVQQYATFNGQLTLFRDSSGMTAPPSAFTVLIDWGDGTTPTAGTITQPGGAGDFYYISGSHTYTDYGLKPATITVTDTAVTASPLTAAGHGSVNVFPVIATHYSLTIPTTIVAGTPFNAAVVARDVNENIATAYSGTVHFTSTDPKGTLPADTRLTNGQGSFPATLYTAAPNQFRARDTASSSITAVSNILVTPGPYDHFTIATPPTALTGVAFYAMVSARDQYENIITSYAKTVHVSSSDTTAVLPANFALTGGSKQISIKFRTPGTQTISLTDTGTALTGTSSNISVGLAPALFVITGPAHPVAGTQALFTVTAKDTVGNTVPGYTGTVHITSTDANAVLPADAVLSNGVGSFYITFKTAGPQTVFAVDTATSTIKGSLSGIGVVGGVATTFAITAPATAAPNTAFLAQVTAKDAYGNTSTGYTGTVRFTSTDPAAVLPANVTLPGGTRQITVKFKTAGNQTISTTDTVNTGVTGTSASVSVH